MFWCWNVLWMNKNRKCVPLWRKFNDFFQFSAWNWFAQRNIQKSVNKYVFSLSEDWILARVQEHSKELGFKSSFLWEKYLNLYALSRK